MTDADDKGANNPYPERAQSALQTIRHDLCEVRDGMRRLSWVARISGQSHEIQDEAAINILIFLAERQKSVCDRLYDLEGSLVRVITDLGRPARS